MSWLNSPTHLMEPPSPGSHSPLFNCLLFQDSQVLVHLGFLLPKVPFHSAHIANLLTFQGSGARATSSRGLSWAMCCHRHGCSPLPLLIDYVLTTFPTHLQAASVGSQVSAKRSLFAKRVIHRPVQKFDKLYSSKLVN